MNNSNKKDKLTLTLTVDIDHYWNDLWKNSDLFRSNICGYWAKVIQQFNPKLGWLIFDALGADGCYEEKPNLEEAIRAWKNGTKLPAHYYRLDEQAAHAAYIEGIKRNGINWFDRANNYDYDIVIQLALLGSNPYG